MSISFYPYQLEFRYPFRIHHGMRTHTDVVYLRIQREGHTGWGEATLPPYLPDTQQSVIDFLLKIDFDSIRVPFNPRMIFEEINQKHPGNMPAKAALDMALWDLKSNLENKSVGELLGVSGKYPIGTYTIGVCSFSEMKEKVAQAEKEGFQMFKIKLDGENDEQMISDFKKLSQLPFAVDVNQGWKSAEEAIEKIKWLKSHGCVLVEQPLAKDAWDEMKKVKANSVLPVYADESCQQLPDLDKVKESFHGVNIKLMKCGGISPAMEIISKAREYELKVLIGCMSESSVGCSAASYLTPLADYADLDGPYLIANDAFQGVKVKEGRINPATLMQKQELFSTNK